VFTRSERFKKMSRYSCCVTACRVQYRRVTEQNKKRRWKNTLFAVTKCVEQRHPSFWSGRQPRDRERSEDAAVETLLAHIRKCRFNCSRESAKSGSLCHCARASMHEMYFHLCDEELYRERKCAADVSFVWQPQSQFLSLFNCKHPTRTFGAIRRDFSAKFDTRAEKVSYGYRLQH
jgi:hypothetical protein